MCPFCRVGSMQFHEASATDNASAPAWLCESADCGYRTLVRRPAHATGQQPQVERARTLSDRALTARRRSMKVGAKAQDLLKRSETLGSKRARKTR